jgi:succinate dehydrogenase/fumarate reductase flavoprotein subunit
MQEFKGIMNEEEYAKGVLSRRALLSGAAVLAAGLAVGGIAGCGPTEPAGTGGGANGPEGEPQTPEGPGEVPAGPGPGGPPQATPNDSFSQAWLEAAPGLTDADATETIETDFLIIGAGVAGISAGLSARMENPSMTVTVIEKTDSFTVRGLVFGAVDATIQTEAGITYDREQIFLDWMKYSGNRANPLLVKKWLNESGSCYDWFAAATTEEVPFQPRLEHWPQPDAFDNSTEYYRQWNTGIEYTDATGADIWASPDGVISEFYKKSVREGVEYVFNTEAKQLATAADGSIEGAYADQAGKIVKFVGRKGTMLATGDYGANVEMLKALCPEFYLALRNQPTMIATSTGDGHKMAIWAGAQLEPAPHAHMSHAFAGGFFGLGATAALQLNSFGRRWTNEDVPGQSFTNALLRQPNAMSYQIWDDGHVDDMLYHQSIGHGNREMQLVTPESLAAQHESWKEALAPGYEGFMWAGNTLDELFEKLGLPVDVAKAEVERYNELCAKGHDDDFFKRADRMYPVSEGPFYASMAFIAAGVMTAGVMVDGDLQVINADGVPLGKLWAAGNVAGGRYSIDYPTNCPATSHGTAITFGRAIGRQLAAL